MLKTALPALGWAAAVMLLAGCPTADPGEAMDPGSASSSDDDTGEADGVDSDEPTGEADGPATTGGPDSDTSEDDDTTGSDTTAPEDTGESGESTGTGTETGPDLREMGSFAIETGSGSSQGSSCSMSYDIYTPAGIADAPVVVLAHGFQSSRASMAGWAQHWASWGVQVVAPDLCHATIIDTDHAQNGADLVALADDLELGAVIYAGYSAGGLASVLAAAADPETIAVLGLDMVDADGLGVAAAPNIIAPAFDIVGESSMCNTTNNGLDVFQAAGGQALRVSEADHCDFQNPADFLCGLTCSGSNTQFDDETIQATVRGLSTAVITWQTGVEPTGEQWWTPGSYYYEELSALGILQAP